MAKSVNLWREPEHAQRYVRQRATIPHREEGYAVLGELLPARPRRVLDLGCGDGEVTGRVLTSETHAVAADFSPEMLRRVRERFSGDPRVTIVEHDLDDPLPHSWGTFDVVVSAFAIHHLVDDRKRALYAEVYEHLEPGGVFANLEHVASPTESLHEAFFTSFGLTLADDDPSNKLVAVEPQLEWLRAVGFVDVDCFWKWRELALLAGTKPG